MEVDKNYFKTIRLDILDDLGCSSIVDLKKIAKDMSIKNIICTIRHGEKVPKVEFSYNRDRKQHKEWKLKKVRQIHDTPK